MPLGGGTGAGIGAPQSADESFGIWLQPPCDYEYKCLAGSKVGFSRPNGAKGVAMFSKSISGLAAGAFLGVAALAGSARADSLKLNYAPGVYSDGTHGGGEFQAYDLQPNPGYNFVPQGSQVTLNGTSLQTPGSFSTPTFQTFCVEDTVYFYPGTMYYTAPVTMTHDLSGDPARPLTAQVAYLFDRFWSGALSTDPNGTYNYSDLAMGGRSASATSLQEAIWTLIGDPNWAGYTFNGAKSTVAIDNQAKKWYDEANTYVATHPNAGIGNVRILQLSQFSNGRGAAQDQLIEVSTPLPCTAYAGVGLLGGLALVQVRRRMSCV